MTLGNFMLLALDEIGFVRCRINFIYWLSSDFIIFSHFSINEEIKHWIGFCIYRLNQMFVYYIKSILIFFDYCLNYTRISKRQHPTTMNPKEQVYFFLSLFSKFFSFGDEYSLIIFTFLSLSFE